MKQIVFFLITLSVLQVKAQSVTIPFNPEWLQSNNIIMDAAKIELLKFKGALYDDSHTGLPVFLTEIPIDKNDGRVSIEEIISEPISWNYWQEKEQEKFNEIQLSASVEKEGNNYFAKIILIPIFKKSGQWHKITSARIVFSPFNKIETNLRNTNFKQESVLKSGNIFQLSIPQKGVYQIKTDFIRSQLKLDPATIDPRQIKLYAGQSGMLPFAVNNPNIDDLEEIPIKVFGEEDGKWDPNDYLVFYAEGANSWIEDAEKQIFTFQNNFFSNTQFLYLIVSTQNGKRIINQKLNK